MTTRVLLYRGSGSNIVSKAIRYFTESQWEHVAIYVRGNTYEQTWPGVRKTPGQNPATLVMIPPQISESDETRMIVWLEDQAAKKVRYNWMKLVVLAIVYPLRWFFNKIGWVPFQAALFGEVCSTFVDQALKVGGVDLFPERGEEATVPGDYARCRELVTEWPA